jgi:hypothetical protein
MMPRAVQDGRSCSTPVFRYALERWKPDPYKGIFIYRGKITERDRALLQRLEQATMDPESSANLLVREVEISSFSEERLKALLMGPIPQRLPALAIWYPDQMGKKAPLWILELPSATATTLTNSPKREQLAESLINGDSIVWIFIPSGDRAKDEKARSLIQQELDVALNAWTKMPFYVLAGSGQKRLPYRFSILTLLRADPEESFLLDMLLNSEPDLHEHKNEPMVFPVFGRGRLLGCLFGDYISAKNIQDVVSFLAGSCSCEVKAMNPGIDLLLSAFWDRVVIGDLYAEDDAELPELTGVMPKVPENEGAEQLAKDFKGERKNNGPWMAYGITYGSLALLVILGGLILSRRRKRD